MMRYARYAAAVLFALLAVGFMALWVRSYTSYDSATGPVGNGHQAVVEHCFGIVIINLYQQPPNLGQWACSSNSADGLEKYVDRWKSFTALGMGFSFKFKSNSLVGYRLMFPHWFLAASSLGLAALFVFKHTWRFSLRTILVATTLLAGLLGLVVYVV